MARSSHLTSPNLQLSPVENEVKVHIQLGDSGLHLEQHRCRVYIGFPFPAHCLALAGSCLKVAGRMRPGGISSQCSVLWLSTVMNQNSQALRTTALVSCGCHDKLPQTWWLNKTAFYSSTVLEVRSSKSRGWHDWLLL